MKTSAQEFYEKHGFQLISTGGNCTGFEKTAEECGCQILITLQDEPVAPKEAGQPVTIGLYSYEGLQLATMNAPDGDAAMTRISQGTWEPYEE